MCVAQMADIIYNFNDLNELTACALMTSIFYLAMIRLIIFSFHQKDMLYVVETMRKDWIYSSHEDRIILKEKCLFAFRLAKCFLIMVTVTVTIFSFIPILEVRTRSHIFNISKMYNIYMLFQDTKIVEENKNRRK